MLTFLNVCGNGLDTVPARSFPFRDGANIVSLKKSGSSSISFRGRFTGFGIDFNWVLVEAPLLLSQGSCRGIGLSLTGDFKVN